MAMLSAGHMFNDINQGAVPALLPFLIAERGLSYAAAAGLVLAAALSSSIIQPLLGYYSDRRPLPWLMPVGILMAGLGIALAGVAPNYASTFFWMVLSGIGVAAFHPESSRFANYVSGTKRATGMSLFTVGGNVGVALGPVILTMLVLAFGPKGTLFLIVPAALMSLILTMELPRLMTFRPDVVNGRVERTVAVDAWVPFTKLTGVIACRSFVHFGMMTFLPLYYIVVFKASKTDASTALSVLLVAGAIGTLIGGKLADWLGRRVVLIGSLAVLTRLILGFIVCGKMLAAVFIALIGAVNIATFSITVVMGQEYLPGRIGVASGFTLGLAIGLGGVGAPLLGMVADRYGLTATLYVIAALPLLALGLALTLPQTAPDAIQSTSTLTRTNPFKFRLLGSRRS